MNDSSFDLHACVERVRQSDEQAARELVERMYPLVARIAGGRLPRRTLKEDLVQEIFMRMFAKLDQYHGAVPFEHWLSTLSVNHCLNALRAEKRRPELRWADLSEDQAAILEASASGASHDPQPAQAIAARELVDRLLDPLSPEDQWLLRLLEIEERSVQEIHQLTGWSLNKIRTRACRARKKLNRLFAKLKSQGELGI